MTAGIGHNQGPVLDTGTSWRRHCWSRARRDLLPRLPIEVLRNRVRRAQQIGLDYTTYATVRASTGRDIVAFLFSTNALRLFRADQALAADRAARLAEIAACERRALAIAPLRPAPLLSALRRQHGDILDAAAAAPQVHDAWSDAAVALDAALAPGMPADAVLLIGDTAMERDWSAAGRLAGYLSAARFFTQLPG